MLLVIVYHYFPAWLPGGYVGVDVFFVISGFLITRSLTESAAEHSGLLSWLLNFWSRRLRRLMPSALTVLLVFSVAGVLLLSEFSIKRLGSDVFWAAVYSANWLFVLRSTDYLAWNETQRSFLLNFWSLAVEEQFYIAWPLILLPLLGGWSRNAERPSARRAGGALAVLIAISFACMIWQSSNNLTLAFFSTPARAWELWVGALIALVAPASGRIVGSWRFALRAVGLALVFGSGMAFSDATVHPGWMTLAPVLGAALLVAPLRSSAAEFDPGDAVGTWLLSWRPMQLLGARSYSVYLWHWPVLVFGSILWPGRDATHQLALLALAVVVAELAYRGIELPCRYRLARGWSARRLIAVALAASASLAGVGAAVRAIGANDTRELAGLRPARGSLELPSLDRIANDLPVVYRNGCQLAVEIESSPPCLFGKIDGQQAVVVFGDSHAAQWFSAIDIAARTEGVRFYSFTKSSCASVDADAWNSGARAAFPQCDSWREATLQRIEVLAPRWVFLSNLVEAAPSLVDRRTGQPLRGGDAAPAWTDGLARVIARLQKAGIGVIVIRDNPRPRPDIHDCLFSAHSIDRCDLTLAEATGGVPPLDLLAARRGGAIVWDFTADICPMGRCPTLRNGSNIVVYRDSNHLTDTFVRELAPVVVERWQATLRETHERLRR